MRDTGLAVESDNVGQDRPMTLSQLRHDMRNYLNAIRLSSALLQRRMKNDEISEESLREIDQAVDGINEMITRYMGDADAPSLLKR